jgi:hypothetical protein
MANSIRIDISFLTHAQYITSHRRSFRSNYQNPSCQNRHTPRALQFAGAQLAQSTKFDLTLCARCNCPINFAGTETILRDLELFQEPWWPAEEMQIIPGPCQQRGSQRNISPIDKVDDNNHRGKHHVFVYASTKIAFLESVWK